MRAIVITDVLAGLAILSVIGITIYRRFRFSVKHIRGPPGASFWRGNMRDFFYQKNVGDMDFQFVKEYGLTWRMKAALGQDWLMTADPKVIHHIFVRSGYNYSIDTEKLATRNLLIGPSLFSAPNGSIHSRHRKVMTPAFYTPQIRTFLSLFRRDAAKMSRLMREELLQGSSEDGQVMPMNKWLSRATLDAIGEAAFNYDLGALDNAKNELCLAYENIFVKSRIHPTIVDTLFRATWRFLPMSVLDYIKYLPRREYKSALHTRQVVDRVAGGLVDDAIKNARGLGVEKGQKDVLSVLVRANLSENPRVQLSKREMMAQIGALTLAGHETTANTLTWMLWELAKHPDFQETLREEIREKRKEIALRDPGADFSIEDLESMQFLQAVVKETLRFHVIMYHMMRVALKDDVIPLSEPIYTADGRMIDQIPVAKGQTVVISTCAYHRLKNWGEDADKFNPWRFLNGSVEHDYKIGPHANVMTFSAGLRTCIGFRFALMEVQAMIVDLIENFEFSPPPKEHNIEIVRKPIGLMYPMLAGRMDEGVVMPLVVKAL